MSWVDCIKTITEAAGDALSSDEIKALADEVNVRLSRQMAKGMGRFDAADQVGQQMAGEATLAAMLKKREAHINFLKDQNLESRTVVGKENSSLLALLSGDTRSAEFGAAQSTWAKRGALTDSWLGPMVDKLEKAGILKAVMQGNKELDRDIAVEMARRQDPEGKVAPTGNKIAEHAAEILGEAQEKGRLYLNKQGAWIAKIDNYIAQQAHDMMKLRKAGLEGWKDTIRPLLDAQTFDDVEDQEAYLNSVYKALSSGLHDHPPAVGAEAGFSGPGNLAKKLSQSRSLIFKDPDSWVQYNSQFGKGHGRVVDAVIAGIDKAARDGAVMDTFGANPAARYEAYRSRLQRAAVDRGDLKMSDKLKQSAWQNLFDTVSGAANEVVNPSWAKFGTNVRNFQQVTKLGGVVLSSTADMVNVAATLRRNGVGLLEAYGVPFRQLFSKASRQEMQAVGATIESLIGHAMHRFRTEDDLPGKLTSAVGTFHKLNGLEYWTTAMKGAVADGISHSYGAAAGRTFESLPPLTKQTLTRYGIDEAAWDSMRRGAAKGSDDRAYLMPEDIADEGVREKYQTLISDQVRRGLNEPSARVRSAVTFGTRAGTWQGEAIRAVMQFKSFGLSMLENQVAPLFMRGQQVDLPGAIHLAIGSMLLGYLGNQAKQMMQGKTPEIPKDAHGIAAEMLDALRNGGALGTLGDFALTTGMKQSIGDTLMGPSLSTADKLYQMIQDVETQPKGSRGRMDKIATEGVPLIHSLIPGNNLPVIGQLVNYLFLYGLQDKLSPGFLQRQNKRMQDNGQKYLIAAPRRF